MPELDDNRLPNPDDTPAFYTYARMTNRETNYYITLLDEHCTVHRVSVLTVSTVLVLPKVRHPFTI